jgi:hypothetical protein
MRRTIFGFLATLSMLCISGAGSGNAAAHGGFSLASLRGSYAGIFSGEANTASGLLPILGTGVFVADGHGNLTGHETYTVVTTPCEATISGTFGEGPYTAGYRARQTPTLRLLTAQKPRRPCGGHRGHRKRGPRRKSWSADIAAVMTSRRLSRKDATPAAAPASRSAMARRRRTKRPLRLRT